MAGNEPQNGTALPPRDFVSDAMLMMEDDFRASELAVLLEDQQLAAQRLIKLMDLLDDLARIHVLVLELQRGTNVVPVRAVVDEIARLSNLNAPQ